MNHLSPPISRLGRYDIARVLGQGAMGVVYEARDPNLGRRVAIKTVRVAGMPPEEALDYEKRFDTEARSAGRLQHPNIVSVYDSSNHEDAYGKTAYIVMEFVEGEDVKHLLDRGQRFSLKQTVGMIDDLLTALDVAHRNKIIHRDIKPANMMLTREGRIKLTDFGVARIQDSGEATKTQGSTVGTLKYMSPEQVAGRGVDASSDLFSVGIVLYQLLTGLRPFDGDGYLDIVSKIMKLDPKPPSQLASALPTALDAVVARALAKNKLDRFADAASFAQALKAAVSQADLSATPSMHASLASTVSSSSGVSSSSSTVTKELELVYWKDIKESQNPDILEGFLRRFPEGTYADLAKHKLKLVIDAQKVSGEASRYETTQLRPPSDLAAQQDVGSPPAQRSGDATATLPLVRTDPATPLPPLAHAAPTAAPSSNIVYADVMDSWPAGMSPHGNEDVNKRSSQVSEAKVKPKSNRLWLLGGVATLALAGLYAVFLRAPPSPTTAVAPTPQIATKSIAPTAALTPALSVPAASTVSVNASAGLSGSQTSSSSPQASASPAETSSASAPVASVAQAASGSRKPRPAERATAPKSTPIQENKEDREASAATSRTPANPRQACADRVLFGYHYCMKEQCAKPLYRNHRVCVERRELEERRQTYENTR